MNRRHTAIVFVLAFTTLDAASAFADISCHDKTNTLRLGIATLEEGRTPLHRWVKLVVQEKAKHRVVQTFVLEETRVGSGSKWIGGGFDLKKVQHSETDKTPDDGLIHGTWMRDDVVIDVVCDGAM